MNIAIIFPHQLFELKYLYLPYKEIDLFVIVEDPLFFSDQERNLRFNMLKLIYQRASMKYYQQYLDNQNIKTKYLNWQPKYDYWMKYIKDHYGASNNLHISNPIDHLLESRMDLLSSKFKQKIIYYETPYFLSSTQHLADYVSSMKNQNHYSQYNFYIWQRKRLGLLLDKNNRPIGGKYSYDKYNRKAIPDNDFESFILKRKIQLPTKKYNNNFYTEAIKYCEKTFENHYKENYTPSNIYLYPITHADVRKHFNSFIKYKLKYFGDYEDAMDFSTDNEYHALFHSIISPQLNNGLVTSKWIMGEIIKYYHASKNKVKILPAIEGYIRQLNWREYSHLLYRYAYDRMKRNYFNNSRKLNKKWYNGTTGIVPVDHVIKLAFSYGYIHHILRLMVMCNFMNLCQIHPSQAYNWFMEFSLDSYDWVMINNVYSMGFYADGGLTTTKPYISSSNYLLKQSNLKYNSWCG